MKRILAALLLIASAAWGEPGHSGSVSISTTRIGPSGSLLIQAEGTNDKISITTGNFRRVSSTQFFGDGSGLTGISASVPANISVTNAYVGGTVSGSSLISTTSGGVVSSTYGYFRYISGTAINGTFSGNGAGLTGITAGASDRIVSTSANIVVGNGGGVSLSTGGVSNTASFGTNGVLTVPGISATANLTSVTSLYASGKVGINGSPTGSAWLTVSGLVSSTSMFTPSLTILTGSANGIRWTGGSSISENGGNGVVQWNGNGYYNTGGASNAFNAFDPASQAVIGCPDFSCIASGNRLAVNGTTSTTNLRLQPGNGSAPFTCNAAAKGMAAMASNTVINTCNGSAWQNPVGAAAVW